MGSRPFSCLEGIAHLLHFRTKFALGPDAGCAVDGNGLKSKVSRVLLDAGRPNCFWVGRSISSSRSPWRDSVYHCPWIRLQLATLEGVEDPLQARSQTRQGQADQGWLEGARRSRGENPQGG